LKISRTKDYELIARLNKYVHDVHAKLYPEYFKEYEYDATKDFFKGIINTPNFISSFWRMRANTLDTLGSRLESIQKMLLKSHIKLYMSIKSVSRNPFEKKAAVLNFWKQSMTLPKLITSQKLN
jgi:hypothetical protein